jgi:hypothetical protein
MAMGVDSAGLLTNGLREYLFGDFLGYILLSQLFLFRENGTNYAGRNEFQKVSYLLEKLGA